MNPNHDLIEDECNKMWNYVADGAVIFRENMINTLNILAKDNNITIKPLSDVLIIEGADSEWSIAHQQAYRLYTVYRTKFSCDLGFGFIVIDGTKTTAELLKEYEDKCIEGN